MCVRADTVRQCSACGVLRSETTFYNGVKKEKRKREWCPILLKIPGCVYTKTALVVSGNGKISGGWSNYGHLRI